MVTVGRTRATHCLHRRRVLMNGNAETGTSRVLRANKSEARSLAVMKLAAGGARIRAESR